MKSFARVTGVVIVLAIAFILALATPVFAAGGALNLKESSPKSGATNVPIENVGIKLIFDKPMDIPAGEQDMYKKYFTLTDDQGNIVECIPYRGQKEGEENYVLVIARPVSANENQPGQLLQDSDYVLAISGELMSEDGSTLGEDVKISFRTMDVKANSRLSMIIMVLMMVAVIALMVITNGRKMKAEAEAAALAKANPYRIAKDKGITVDAAKELIEKAKERNQKQLEKTGGKAPEPVVEKKASAPKRLDAGKKKKDTVRVKRPRPISEGGSTYKKGRKAEKERKERAAAARKGAQKKTGATGSSKGRKGKGKK